MKRLLRLQVTGRLVFRSDEVALSTECSGHEHYSHSPGRPLKDSNSLLAIAETRCQHLVAAPNPQPDKPRITDDQTPRRSGNLREPFVLFVLLRR